MHTGRPSCTATCMPKIENTSMSVRTTPKTFATAGNALTSEVMMSFIPGLRETSRSGRSARITPVTRDAFELGESQRLAPVEHSHGIQCQGSRGCDSCLSHGWA